MIHICLVGLEVELQSIVERVWKFNGDRIDGMVGMSLFYD